MEKQPEQIEEVEMRLDELGLMGVHAISVVSNPAMEAQMLKLSKDHEVKLKAVNEEKRLLMGAVMIPEKRILRKKDDGTPFYIWFSADTIEQVAQQFQKDLNQQEITLEHQKPITGVTVVETWLVSETFNDKSNAHGLTYPPGTWVVSMKVDSAEQYEQIKNSKVTGFSLEGKFQSPQKLSATEQLLKIIRN